MSTLGLGLGLEKINIHIGDSCISPTVLTNPTISGSLQVGDTLTVSGGTFSGTTPITYSYQWKRGATPVGINSTTYQIVSDDLGQNITCEITATNACGNATSVSNTLVPEYNADALAHITRVQADGGVVDSPALCNNYFIYKAANSFMADVIVDTFPHVLGYKEGATSLKCSKIYGSAADGSGDIVQTNASYQPLLLRYAGEKYVYLPNLTGGNITTNGINGYANYLQIEAKLDITNLNNGLSTYSGIAAQRTNVDTGVFSLHYDDTGLLYQLYYYNDNLLGLQRRIDVSSVPITGTEKYLRATTQLNPTSISTVFESSMDGVSWTQVGTTITNSGIAPISFNNEPTTKLSIGSTNEGLASGISAKIYYCKIRQSAGVDTVVFDFAGYNPAISETA